jgi:hypothetical protein
MKLLVAKLVQDVLGVLSGVQYRLELAHWVLTQLAKLQLLYVGEQLILIIDRAAQHLRLRQKIILLLLRHGVLAHGEWLRGPWWRNGLLLLLLFLLILTRVVAHFSVVLLALGRVPLLAGTAWR